MRELKIFLASSEELEIERSKFSLYIRETSEIWEGTRNIKLVPILWEKYFTDFISSTKHQQDEYNEEIKKCDFFVMLYWTKVGDYTKQEFEVALKQFDETKKKPLIIAYFMNKDISKEISQTDKDSLQNFRTKLSERTYEIEEKDIGKVQTHFKDRIERALAQNILQKNDSLDKSEILKLLDSDFDQAIIKITEKYSELYPDINDILIEYYRTPNSGALIGNFRTKLKLAINLKIKE